MPGKGLRCDHDVDGTPGPIILEMPKRTWRMRLTDARLWWWWHLRGRRENMR